MRNRFGSALDDGTPRASLFGFGAACLAHGETAGVGAAEKAAAMCGAPQPCRCSHGGWVKGKGRWRCYEWLLQSAPGIGVAPRFEPR